MTRNVTLDSQAPGLQVLGTSHYTFTITIAEDAATIRQMIPSVRGWTVPLAFVDGLGSLIPLPGTGYYCRPTTDLIGASWSIDVRVRPTLTLGEIAALLEISGEPTLIGLFGLDNVEPYRTFQNLWRSKQGLSYRLGGLLLALIYRSEEVRLGTS